MTVASKETNDAPISNELTQQKTTSLGSRLQKWLVNDNLYDPNNQALDKTDWLRAVPFLLLHLSCLLVFWVGYSKVAVITAAVLYFVRLFSVGAFYHRYFSHKTYQTNRFWQFIFAILAGSAAQRGPLWWAAHHRQHHLTADQPEDAHSPVQHGFWRSHVGWFLSTRYYYYNPTRVRDLARYPELVFLERYDSLVPLLLLAALLGAGSLLHHFAPHYATNAVQMGVWGFAISTTLLFHSSVSINSLSHVIGKKRFPTKDNSRNHFLLALLTLGEGWHNNHHYYPASTRQGFRWWEIDVTYYILCLMEKMGIISNIKAVPKKLTNNSWQADLDKKNINH